MEDGPTNTKIREILVNSLFLKSRIANIFVPARETFSESIMKSGIPQPFLVSVSTAKKNDNGYALILAVLALTTF